MWRVVKVENTQDSAEAGRRLSGGGEPVIVSRINFRTVDKESLVACWMEWMIAVTPGPTHRIPTVKK